MAATAILLALAGAATYRFLAYRGQWLETANAVIQGPVYAISSPLPGMVRSIAVEENQRVDRGAVLARLDPAVQELAVRRARAAVAAQALVVSALTTPGRRGMEWEAARARQAELELVLEEAELMYQKTTILAPSSGYVAHRQVEPGEYVLPGQPLLAIVDLDRLWVVANFTEAQVTGIRPGQTVEVRVDAFPDRVMRARVESIMAASGSVFALFPPDASAGNWVRVAARIPVRVILEDGAGAGIPLRVGMLARVRIRR
jgi:membrane fusion protein (multidrug efflux system)